MSHNFPLEAALLLIMIINCVTEPFYEIAKKKQGRKKLSAYLRVKSAVLIHSFIIVN